MDSKTLLETIQLPLVGKNCSEALLLQASFFKLGMPLNIGSVAIERAKLFQAV